MGNERVSYESLKGSLGAQTSNNILDFRTGYSGHLVLLGSAA